MRRAIFAATAAGLLLVTAGVGAQQQPTGPFAVTRDSRALSSVDRMVSNMERAGDLVLQRAERDPLVAGLEHQRYQQRHLGIPVWGATVVRQLTAQERPSRCRVGAVTEPRTPRHASAPTRRPWS